MLKSGGRAFRDPIKNMIAKVKISIGLENKVELRKQNKKTMQWRIREERYKIRVSPGGPISDCMGCRVRTKNIRREEIIKEIIQGSFLDL